MVPSVFGNSHFERLSATAKIYSNLVNFSLSILENFAIAGPAVALFDNCPSVFQSASLDVSSGVCKSSRARVNFCMCVCSAHVRLRLCVRVRRAWRHIQRAKSVA